MLETGSSVAIAARAAGVGLRTMYNWRSQDAEFAARWSESYQMGTDALEDEARRRAVDGVPRQKFWNGQPIMIVDEETGERRPYFEIEYSDNLLMFILKRRDPESFCDQARLAALKRKWAKEDGLPTGTTITAESVVAALDVLRSRLAAPPANFLEGPRADVPPAVVTS